MAKDFKAFCAKGHERLDFDGYPDDYVMHMKHEHDRHLRQVEPGAGRAHWRESLDSTEPPQAAPGMRSGAPIPTMTFHHI